MSVHGMRVHAQGGTEVLSWEPVEVGHPGPGEVRIRHTAIGLNFIDVYFRSGVYAPPTLPFIPGHEGAGVVVAVGPEVDDLREGDRVAYASILGAYCEERLLPADRVVKLPESISDELAAAMMLKGMTAQYLLHRTFPVQAGQTLLFHSAAGGVGLIACQWAKALGATVIGTVSTRQKAELARANGTHHAVVTAEEDFVERVKTLTEGRGVPVVYDSVGQATFMRSLDCLQPRGTMVSFGQSSGKVPPLDVTVLSAKGSLFLTRPSLHTYVQSRSELVETAAALFDAVSSGKVKVTIPQRYPLREVARAHADLEGRRTTGSTVLTV